MNEKKRTILLCVFVCLLIVTLLTFSLTRARYSGEHESESEYGSDIEYTVSNQVEVSTADEFFTAIENGYSNIVISDEAEDTIIITGGVSDVNSDLTIDLNGHELQRNNRDPILNVSEGIRLTVVDSKGGGGFYNPVGSVLRISGGTLTVTAGLFESGPRDGKSLSADSAVHPSEYASGSGSDWSASGAGSFTSVRSGNLYIRSGTSYGEPVAVTDLPVIIPTVTAPEEGETKARINGNMYFDEGVSISLASASGKQYITEDTYLYCTVESALIQNSTISAGSADFYYTYTLYQETNASGVVTGYSTDASGDGEEVDVTVYGYNAVKETSKEAGSTFAAIQMNSGDLYTRGGEYVSYFGNDGTYCVYASGGYMSVSGGTVFEAHEYGVCVNIAYATDHAEDEYLGVRGGDFYSAAGDTIRVSGGEMYVRGGTFTKDATGYSASAVGGNGSAIAISGGTLDIEGTDQRIVFNMAGSYMNSIHSTASDSGSEGTVSVTNADFTFAGDNNYGINSEAGKVTAMGCVFTLPGTNSRGISVSRGTVTVGGAGSVGTSEGISTDQYSFFYLDSAQGCYGVYAQTDGNENATVNMNAAQIFVGQSASASAGSGSYNTLNGAGIYMNAGENSSVNLGNVFLIAAGNSVSGVYVESGSIAQNTGKLVVITGAKTEDYAAGQKEFSSEPAYGADAEGNITDLTGQYISAQSNSYTYGVYSAGGSVQLNDVYAAVYGNYSAGILVDARVASGTTAPNAAVTVKGSLAMRVAGGNLSQGNNPIASAAGISTEGGDITLNKGADIFVSNGLGITARAGTVTFAGGTDTAMNTVNITTPQSTGIYVNNGELFIGEVTNGVGNGNITANIVSNISYNTIVIDEKSTNYYCLWASAPSGNSEGGVATIENQYDGVYVQGGSLYAYGTFNVTHTGAENDESQSDDYAANELYRNYAIKSFAVRVDSGSASDTDNKTEVSILKGEIKNSVGGGLYVSGGEVVMGAESATSSDTITISTEGNLVYEGYHNQQNQGDNWNYRLSQTGGHAVEVAGGNLTIYYGTYTATQGEGILVRDGTANIWKGSFDGNDVYDAPAGNGALLAGPSASYAFKMYGGTANIYGGTFGAAENSKCSGAFVMGTSEQNAEANIYGGTFDVKGQAGFSVFEYVDVTFSPRGGENSAGSDILVRGVEAGMTVEYRGNANSSITIEGGTFEGTSTSYSNGIWYGEGRVSLTISRGSFIAKATSDNRSSGLLIDSAVSENGKIEISDGTFTGYNGIRYNQQSSKENALVISGGTFTGNNRSGLYFNAAPSDRNVQISGGTFVGNEATHEDHNGLFGSVDYYTNGGAIGCVASHSGSGFSYSYTGLTIRFDSIFNAQNVYGTNDDDTTRTSITSGSVAENLAAYRKIIVE